MLWLMSSGWGMFLTEDENLAGEADHEEMKDRQTDNWTQNNCFHGKFLMQSNNPFKAQHSSMFKMGLKFRFKLIVCVWLPDRDRAPGLEVWVLDRQISGLCFSIDFTMIWLFYVCVLCGQFENKRTCWYVKVHVTDSGKV